MHQVAETYSARPSDVLGIANDWLAYQVDVAVLQLGRRIENLTADGKVSVEAALARIEAEAGEGRPEQGTSFAGQKWADPRPMVSRTMEIPESGIW